MAVSVDNILAQLDIALYLELGDLLLFYRQSNTVFNVKKQCHKAPLQKAVKTELTSTAGKLS